LVFLATLLVGAVSATGCGSSTSKAPAPASK
jgi:hypothetical protein